MIDTSLFPYETFPIRLEFGDKKNSTICYFQCHEHLDKYLERHRLNKKTIKINYRDEKPIRSCKTNKRGLEQKSKSESKRSSSSIRNRTTSMDSSKHTTRNSNRKK